MAAKTIQLDIVTPEKITFSSQVEFVALPAMEGELGVLPGHMAYIAQLKAGEMRFIKDGQTESLAVSGGYAEIDPHKVVVLAETAEMSAEIDLSRAKMKADEISHALKTAKVPADEMARMQAAIMKEVVRMKVADKMRRR